ncbi:MAG: LysE family transporter [Anaerolineae bacterium]|nr:LysE family transporter [Anaerolineae bacterium]
MTIWSFFFVRGATLGLSAMASPGPFQAFLLAQTLKNGWRRTLPAALAPLVSDGPIIALVLLVLTQTPDWFLSVLQILGALFILYLAWGAFTAARKVDATPGGVAEVAGQNFLKAALMNALSPGPYLFWGLVAGPIVIEGWRQSPTLGLGFVLGFYLALVGGFAALIILFGTASQLGPRVSKALGYVAAITLLGFGLYQLWRGMSTLMGLGGIG